jgi:M6 family metalloprotease-like protein
MRVHIWVVLFAVLLVACGTAPSASSSTPQVEASATAAPLPTATSAPTATQSDLGADIAVCQLPDFTGREVGVGFPVIADRLRSTGNVRAAVLFADFEDAPASLTPEQLLAMVDPGAEEFYATFSYRKMQFEFVPHPVWLRLPGPASSYDNTTFEGEKAILQTAADLADADFDFSDMDMLIVLTDPNTTPFAYGPAFTGGEHYGYGGIDVDGATINNGTVSGQDLNYWGYTWLNHETGHLLGLADLYLYGVDDYLQYVQEWSTMGLINGQGQEFFGWERWQLGWLDSGQVACLPEGGATTLTAIETEGGTKIAVVPVSESLAVVVESRRDIGFDNRLPEGGALVYTIDSSIASGEGPLRVQPEGSDLMSAPLASGESLTVAGITVTVTASDELTDTVQITLE